MQDHAAATGQIDIAAARAPQTKDVGVARGPHALGPARAVVLWWSLHGPGREGGQRKIVTLETLPDPKRMQRAPGREGWRACPGRGLCGLITLMNLVRRSISLALAVLVLGCPPPPRTAGPPPRVSRSAAGPDRAAPSWREVRVEPGQPQPRPLPPGAVGRLGSGRLVDPWGGRFALSPDGTLLASAGDGPVTIWDLRSGLRLAQPGCAGEALGLAFDSAGRALCVLTKTRLCSFALPGARRLGERGLEAVLAGQISEDGARLVLLHKGKRATELRVVDAGSGKIQRAHEMPGCSRMCQVGLSPEAEWAALSLDGKLLLVELATGRRLKPSLDGQAADASYYLGAVGRGGQPVWAYANSSEDEDHPREWSASGGPPRVARELADNGLVTDGRWLFGRGARAELPPSAHPGDVCLLQSDLERRKRRCLLVAGDPRPVALRGGRLVALDGARLRVWALTGDRVEERRSPGEAGHGGAVRLARAQGPPAALRDHAERHHAAR